LRHEVKSNAVIVAEADAIDRASIEMVLNCENYAVKLASDVDCVRSHLTADEPVAAVVLGNLSPRKIPVDLLCDIRRRFPVLPVIAISDSPSSGEVVEAMKCGATDVLAKPVCRERLRDALSNALASSDPPMPAGSRTPSPFLANSPAMRGLMSLIHQVGFSDAPILIRGETGVGKEVLARRLHSLSPRAGKPFLKVNCAALPPELIEGELFGYNRGAFTNADQNKPGMFERADTGAILLDEIGDMELRLQAKLLEVLQDQQFYRLGGSKPVRVNVRIIAATHVDLETAVENGAFRADLYHRLDVIDLRVPPLRDCYEDILPLARLLLERHNRPGMPAPGISPELERALLTYHWPGNVRELENVMRRLLVLRNPGLLAAELNGRGRQASLLEFRVCGETPEPLDRSGPVLQRTARDGCDAEVQAILAALSASRWNRKAAAHLLGTGYKALLYKMKKLGIVDTDQPMCRPPKRSPLPTV
jgi:two-component system response regulator AtoC